MAEPTCVVVRDGGSYSGAQGFDYFEGISAQSVGSAGLCMHRLVIPPGGSARPHLHEHHETAIYVLSGRGEMRFGEGLREHLEVRAGDFLFIPAGMPHLPVESQRGRAADRGARPHGPERAGERGAARRRGPAQRPVLTGPITNREAPSRRRS